MRISRAPACAPGLYRAICHFLARTRPLIGFSHPHPGHLSATAHTRPTRASHSHLSAHTRPTRRSSTDPSAHLDQRAAAAPHAPQQLATHCLALQPLLRCPRAPRPHSRAHSSSSTAAPSTAQHSTAGRTASSSDQHAPQQHPRTARSSPNDATQGINGIAGTATPQMPGAAGGGTCGPARAPLQTNLATSGDAGQDRTAMRGATQAQKGAVGDFRTASRCSVALEPGPCPTHPSRCSRCHALAHTLLRARTAEAPQHHSTG